MHCIHYKKGIRGGILFTWCLCQVWLLQAQDHEIRKLHAQLPGVQDSIAYVDKLNRLAFLYHLKNLDTAFLYVEKAQAIANRVGYTKGKADAWQILGNYYELRNNRYLSTRFYMDALQAYKTLADSNGISLVYANLSAYYQYEGRRQTAVHYMNMAMDTGRRLRSDSVYTLILSRFAGIHMGNAAKQDSVQWALEKARNILTRYQDEYSLLQLDLYDIQELFRKGDTAAAEKKLLMLIAFAAHNGYTYQAMYASQLMAAARARQQQADSIQYRVQMVKWAIAGGYRELMLPYAIQLYDWYAKHGKPDTAVQYSHLLLDILREKDAAKTKGEMDYIAYYTQQHNMRALQLKHAARQQVLEKKRLENRNRLFQILFLFVLLVLIALTLFYFYRAYKRSRQNTGKLKTKYAEISEKNALLKTHDDFKNKLISLVAHDFRSPLANIIEITEFLKDESLTPEEAAAWMMQVEHSSSNTLHTFDNILNWVHSQLSGFVYTPESCKPADMVAEALQHLSDLIGHKQLRVVTHIPAALQVLAAWEMLQFVHRNFIHNAIKFSPEGSMLRITAVAADNKVTLSVSDEGPGIPADKLPHLFEYRNNSNIDRIKEQGAGLALIISKDFMDKMGGRLQAANNPGGGATLSYTLPQVKPLHQT